LGTPWGGGGETLGWRGRTGQGLPSDMKVGILTDWPGYGSAVVEVVVVAGVCGDHTAGMRGCGGWGRR